MITNAENQDLEDRLDDFFRRNQYQEINAWIKANGQCFIAGEYNEADWAHISATHGICPAAMFLCDTKREAICEAMDSAERGCKAYAYVGPTMVAFFAEKDAA